MLTGLGRSGSPPATAMDHRLQVATNACFLEAKPAGGRSGQWAASKKRGGQLWVESKRSREAASRRAGSNGCYAAMNSDRRRSSAEPLVVRALAIGVAFGRKGAMGVVDPHGSSDAFIAFLGQPFQAPCLCGHLAGTADRRACLSED